MHICSRQCRAARALLGWSQAEIASAAKVHKRTVMEFENGTRRPHLGTLSLLKSAFETAGVEFIDRESGKGPGVRLREADRRTHVSRR